MGDSWNINWYVDSSDSILESPFWSKYSNRPFDTIDPNDVKSDLAAMVPSRDSAAVVAYLSWILRVKALLA